MDYSRLDTPLGEMVVVADATAIRHVFFADRPNAVGVEGMRCAPDQALLHRAREQLLAYFDGRTPRFDLPLAPAGTDFQRAVWTALGTIDPGRTVSYGELALMLGCEDAVRAVAHAVARNPILILVPCHRVLGADGRLAGFSAGLDRKQRLLELEGARVPAPQASDDYCI